MNFMNSENTKDLAKKKAEEIILDPLYFATMMIYCNKADGMVAGAVNATGNVLRPAFQIVKTEAGISTVSSAIIMVLKRQIIWS